MNSGEQANWTHEPERGSMFLLRLMAWIGMRLGRTVARTLLHPICLYFMLFAPRARQASRSYLTRALGRTARWRDSYRHIHTFAATILDRIYLLNDRMDLFDIRIHNEELVRQARKQGSGRLLLGAHMGSFEVVRALGHSLSDAPEVALLMYEDNARKMSRVMDAINPDATQEIIALGQVDAMMKVQTFLARGTFIGMLADRSFQQDELCWLSFLGQPAPFPLGPFRLAALLRQPLLLMLGLYRGGRRYDIRFELLADFSLPGVQREAMMAQAMQRYVSLLETCCREHPWNWFNFYDFWNIDRAPR